MTCEMQERKPEEVSIPQDTKEAERERSSLRALVAFQTAIAQSKEQYRAINDAWRLGLLDYASREKAYN